MANSLLDFVMSLVRDPDAAARYAADPSQAIADAHLADVTSVDVNNLIPVVSESLSMGAPAGYGADTADHNVWASGAATAAFDAFSDHVPEPAVTEAHQVIPAPADHVVDLPSDPLDAGADYVTGPAPDPHSFAGFDQPIDEGHIADAAVPDPGTFEHHPVDDHGFAAEHPGFEIF